MSQVSYGTITITDTTDITDVFLQYGLALSNALVDNTYTFSENGERGWFITSQDTTVNSDKLYFVKNGNVYNVVVPVGNENPTTENWYESGPYPAWQSGYQIWVRQLTAKEGIAEPEYGTPYLDTAVNQINIDLAGKLDTSEWQEDLALRHWWTNINNDNYDKGTYMAHGIDGVTFDTTNEQTYGFNIANTFDGLSFRYNKLKLTTMQANGIHLYGEPVQLVTDGPYVQNSELVSVTTNGLTINYPGTPDVQDSEINNGPPAVTVTENGMSIFDNSGAQVAQYGSEVLIGQFDNGELKNGIRIGDNELGFYSNKSRTAYVNENKLYIPYSVVLNEMVVGTDENQHDLWAWKVTDDHHLRLVWKGGKE